MEAFHSSENSSYGSIDVPSNPSAIAKKKIPCRYLWPAVVFVVLLFSFGEHSILEQRPLRPLLGSAPENSPFSLLLLRPAKVLDNDDENDNQLTSEFEKPLDSIGEDEAIWVGTMLRNANIPPPDSIFSSPSLQTRETLNLVAENALWNNQLPPVQYTTEWDDLQYGYREYLAGMLKSSPFRRVMVVGHNPAIELLVNQLLPVATFIQVPTGSLIEIQFSTVHDWGEISHAVGAMCLFLNPLNRN